PPRRAQTPHPPSAGLRGRPPRRTTPQNRRSSPNQPQATWHWVQGSWDNSAIRHACPFPAELVRRMLLLSSEVGDVVFDPFAGTGTVVAGARREERRGLGIEVNPDYVSEFRESAVGVRKEKSEPLTVSVMTQRLIELRMLKYPKELAKQVLRAGFTTSQVRAVLMEVESVNYKPARTGYGVISCSIVVDDGLSELENARLSRSLAEVAGKAPLSKYGLKVQTNTVKIAEVGVRFGGAAVSVYTKGHTWHADITLEGDEIEGWIREGGSPKFVPVLSPLHVRQSLEE
ncbi:MAG: site-specific DNA-methyltransferase, partial [Rhodococcus sp. (in: high G+C Gram-positive bacteria)]